MTNPYCSLDTVGFVKEPAVIAERVLADYLSTNYSQSIIFFGKLKSLQRTIQLNAGNMDLTAAAIGEDLHELLSAYLDNVTVMLLQPSLPLVPGSQRINTKFLLKQTSPLVKVWSL